MGDGKGHRADRRRMTSEAYDRQLSVLRDRLLDAQFELKKSAAFAVVLIVVGMPTAGRTESVNRLIEWLDPKLISVNALGAPNADERHRPVLWRYWQVLPPRGRSIVMFEGWYSHLLRLALTEPREARQRERRRVERLIAFEKMLHADDLRVVKICLQVSRARQRQRMKKLQGDPLTAWRITPEDRWQADHYERVDRVVSRCIDATSHADGKWHVLDGTDARARDLALGGILLTEMAQGLKEAARPRPRGRPLLKPRATRPLPSGHKGTDVDDEAYEEELASLQRRLALLTRHKRFRKHALMLAFEGMDAAGKGGAIRRVTHALDARQYRVVPISAPTDEDLAHPYLWRFWRHVPARRRIAIFDRTWYGRVLVERVRGLTAERDWRRAYAEIREFELELTERHIVVAKFWLQVGLDEQRKRFEERDSNRLKRFKVDPEDWKNRRFYAGYQLAAREMIAKTDAPNAPWTIVEADDKKFARLKVLRTVCDVLDAAME
jgi:AMP-polyphosphate phosphotransferase